MAKNVTYQSSKDGYRAGVNSTNSVNEAKKNYVQKSNNFDLNYGIAMTARYADVTPFYAMNAIPKDKIPLRSSHMLRTYTMQSPIVDTLQMQKAYYQVPMKAILPNSWDLIYTNPVQGDDVPDDAYSVSPIFSYLGKIVNNFAAGLSTLSITTTNKGTAFLRHAILYNLLFEAFFSAGSLFAFLGLSSHALFPNVDNIIDSKVVPLLKKFKIELAFDDVIYTLKDNPSTRVNGVADGKYVKAVSVNKFLEILRDDLSLCLKITTVAANGGVSPTTEQYTEALTEFKDGISYPTFSSDQLDVQETDNLIDFSRLVAYQLVCNHFKSNDHVDFIYSAKLYRDNANSFLVGGNATAPSISQLRYTYNDTYVFYDTFSGHSLDFSLGVLSGYSYPIFNDSSVPGQFNNQLSYISLLVGWRRNLKYGDYFTGARPQPLVVGDVTAPIVSNKVNAIDLSVSISKARFLNAVNRFGPRADEYIRNMFDVLPPPVDTDPKIIAKQYFGVGGFEVENTGSEQREANSVTTMLKSSQSKYAFETYTDTPSIIIGLMSFQMPRYYTTAADRFFFHQNRYDMFNKFMQYIGDQGIKTRELDFSSSNGTNFAYTLRYMEYKQRFSFACGGFVNALKSWAMTTNNEDDENYSNLTISPDFIRSSNVEFDRFYTSLTGHSLGTYFHFIVVINNESKCTRAMDYSPSIL